MKDLEFINDHRKKRISKDLNKQLQKHTDLIAINSELIQLSGTTTQKIQLTELLRKINNLYL